MKFSNLSRRLGDYAARGNITQEDALSLISVLWDDIRFESGTPVDRCQVRDWEQLIDELYALSYTVNTLYQTHKTTIQEMEPEDGEGELWQQLRSVEADCGNARNRVRQLDNAQEQLKRREAELREQLALEREKQAQADVCREKVAALEQELSALRSTDLHPLTERYAALEKELAEKQVLLQQLHEETAQIEGECKTREEELQRGHQYLAALEQDRQTLTQKLEQTRTDLQNGCGNIEDLKQQLAAAEQENGTMTTEFVQVRAQLEAQLADNSHFRDENLVQAQQQLNEAKAQAQQMNQTLLAFTGEREEIGAQIAQMGTLIAAKKMDLENRKKQLADRNEELEQLNGQLSSITADLKPLLDEINTRKEQLDGMDREQIETGLRRNLETWQAQIEELEKKQRQCAELQEQITGKTSLVASERAKLEALTAEKQEKDHAYNALCQDVETLNTQLEALKEPEYLQRIEKLQRQQSVLQQLRSNLEQGNRSIGCGWSFELRQDLDQLLSATSQALKDLQKAIQDYAAQCQANINS